MQATVNQDFVGRIDGTEINNQQLYHSATFLLVEMEEKWKLTPEFTHDFISYYDEYMSDSIDNEYTLAEIENDIFYRIEDAEKFEDLELPEFWKPFQKKLEQGEYKVVSQEEAKEQINMALKMIEDNKPYLNIDPVLRNDYDFITKACQKYPEQMTKTMEDVPILPDYVTCNDKLSEEFLKYIVPKNAIKSIVLEQNFKPGDPILNNKKFMIELMQETTDRGLDIYYLLPDDLKVDKDVIDQAIWSSRKNTSETFLDVAPMEKIMENSPFPGSIINEEIFKKIDQTSVYELTNKTNISEKKRPPLEISKPSGKGIER